MFPSKRQTCIAVALVLGLIGLALASDAQPSDTIKPGDRLQIRVSNTLPDWPINGVFQVEASGKVALGGPYGRVQVKGLTLEEAEGVIKNVLAQILKNPTVSVTRYDPLPQAGLSAQVEKLDQRLQQLEKDVRATREGVDELQTSLPKELRLLRDSIDRLRKKAKEKD